MEKNKKWYQKLFNGHLFFTLLVSEVIEQSLEEAIAYGLSWAVGQILSVGLAITVTSSITIVIKKLCKTLTYKEGHDKMNFLKKIGMALKTAFSFIWHNGLTEAMVAVGAYAGYCTYYMAFFTPVWLNIVAAVFVSIFVCLFSIKFGGETSKQIVERLATAKLTKEENSKAKANAKAAAQKYKELKKIHENELKAQAQALVDAEANAQHNE